MTLLQVFNTYYKGIGIENPTSFQNKQFEQLYLEKEIKLCGTVKDVTDYGIVEIENEILCYYDKYSTGEHWHRLNVIVQASIFLNNKSFTLSKLGRRDKIEVEGVIKELKGKDYSSYNNYPCLKSIDEDSIEISFRFSLENCQIKPIKTLWTTPALFGFWDEKFMKPYIPPKEPRASAKDVIWFIISFISVLAYLYFILSAYFRR